MQAIETEPHHLQQVITREMVKQGYTITSLSREMAVNRGLLSSSLNRLTKLIPVPLLDELAKALGHPEGWLYTEYVEECFREKPHWRRVKVLLMRCLDLQRWDLVDDVLDRLMEEPQYVAAVFEMAEELYKAGRKVDAIPLYRCVVQNEIKQHSERFAISHYKWFRAEISQPLDIDRYYRAAIRFSPYLKRLSIHHQLDALLQLANVHFILKKWDDVEKCCLEMLDCVRIFLRQGKGARKNSLAREVAERPLVVYYGQSFLLRGNALEKQGRYKEAFQYIKSYEDLSWFSSLDERGMKEVERLSVFARGNRLNLYILLGEFRYLSDYVDFLDGHKAERLPGLITIIEAALRHKHDVNSILPRFEQEIQELTTNISTDGITYYDPAFSATRRMQLFYGLALYNFNQGLISLGLDYLLLSLQWMMLSNNKLSITCVAWFEKYRNQANPAQTSRYLEIMKGVIGNEEVDGYPFDFVEHCRIV